MTKSVPKLDYLWAMQNYHKNTSDSVVDTIFSTREAVRHELVSEKENFPVSMIDFAEIPDSVSDYDLLKMLANMLDPDCIGEVRKNPNRSNRFILSDDPKNEQITISPILLSTFAGKLANAESDMLWLWYSKGVIDSIKSLHGGSQWNFHNQKDLISFMRKDKVRGEWEMSAYQKTRSIFVMCSLLKQMWRNHDFKKEADNIKRSREYFEKFLRVDLIKDMRWEAMADETSPIQDISDINFFNDKIFIVNHDTLKKYNIHYFHDIRMRIFQRAKSDKSIQDKLAIEPKTTTASILHDVGGITFVPMSSDERSTQKETLILLYMKFLMDAEALQKYHENNDVLPPSNIHFDWFMESWKYQNDNERIEKFLNLMTISGTYDDRIPVMKDTWILHFTEKNKKRNVDYGELKTLWITDSRFIRLLELAAEQKNKKELQKKKKQRKKQDEKKRSIWMDLLPDSVDNERKNTYREKIAKNYQKHKKTLEDMSKKEEPIKQWSVYVYKVDNNSKKIIVGNHEYDWQDIESTYKKRHTLREENRGSVWKWTWSSHKSSNYQAAKISTKTYIGHGEFVAIETQIKPERALRLLPAIDDHNIYGPSKQLLVQGRNASGVLSYQDIQYIVDEYVMKRRNAHPDYITESGKTLQTLKNEIEQDDALLPAWAGLREKIIYNFTHNRWLVKKGKLYYTKFYDNLSHHGLTPPEDE